VVAWWDQRGFGAVNEIYLTFLDREGFEIGANRRIKTPGPASDDEAPTIAWWDGVVGIAYGPTDLTIPPPGPSTRFVAVDSEGRLLAGSVVLDGPATTAGARSVVWTGTAFLVAWESDVDPGPARDFDVLGAVVGPVGDGVVDVDAPLTLFGGPQSSRSPRFVVGRTPGPVVAQLVPVARPVSPSSPTGTQDNRTAPAEPRSR